MLTLLGFELDIDTAILFYADLSSLTSTTKPKSSLSKSSSPPALTALI